MLEHMMRPNHRRFDLNPNLNQLLLVMNKVTLNRSTQINLNDVLSIATLEPTLFKYLMNSPYSLVFQAMINQICMLSFLQHYFEKKLQELKYDEELQKQEFEDDGGAASNDEVSPSLPSPSMPEEKEEHHVVEQTSVKYYTVLSSFQTRLLALNSLFLKNLGIKITEAKTNIVKNASQLGYKFHEDDLSVFNSAVPLAHVQSVVQQSYKDANIQEEQRPVHLVSTVQLELQTLVLLNSYWNRQYNDMVDSFDKNSSVTDSNEPTTTKAEKVRPTSVVGAALLNQRENNKEGKSEAMEKLRKDFQTTYQVDGKSSDQSSSSLGPDSPKPSFPKPEKRDDVRVIHKVGEANKLLKEFRSKFGTLDQYSQELNKLHQKYQEQSADIVKEMREYIQGAKQPAEALTNTSERKASPSLSKN